MCFLFLPFNVFIRLMTKIQEIVGELESPMEQKELLCSSRLVSQLPWQLRLLSPGLGSGQKQQVFGYSSGGAVWSWFINPPLCES